MTGHWVKVVAGMTKYGGVVARLDCSLILRAADE
jgi:hypothetical protein